MGEPPGQPRLVSRQTQRLAGRVGRRPPALRVLREAKRRGLHRVVRRRLDLPLAELFLHLLGDVELEEGLIGDISLVGKDLNIFDQ